MSDGEEKQERERLIAELALERQKLQIMFDLAPAFVAVLRGRDLVFEYVNRAYYQLVGHRPIIGLPLALALPEAVVGTEGQDYDQVLLSVMDSGQTITFRERPTFLQKTAGEPLTPGFLDLSYQPLREPDGAVSGVLVHGIDVTEQVMARRSVQELADKLARQTALWDSALSSITDLVFVFDEEARFRYANRPLLELWGLQLDEVVGKTCEDLQYPPKVAQELRQDVGRVFRAGQLVKNEVTYTSPTGVSGDFAYTLTPIFAKDGSVEAVAGSSRDVAEQNAAQEALRRSEERFRAVLETSPEAFTIIEAIRNPDGEVVDFRWSYVNAGTERLTGERAEDLLGQRLSERRTGIRDRGLFKDWLHTIETGEPFMREEAMDFPKGRTFVRVIGVKVGDGIASSFTDLTERQENEERLQEAVERRTAELQNTVREAEAFNYSIAHDLRSPLRAISSTANILLDELGPTLPEKQRALLLRQNENSIRLGRLIDELLRLSRLARVEVRREKLNMSNKAQIVFDEIESQGRSNGCKILIQENMTVDGDAALMRTVFHNLIGNACKFSPNGGEIKVTESNGVFSVADSGIGFDMAYAAKLFIPFERLVREEEFEGTGIGLANVERIVRRHGGRVWAESEPGKGATFSFTLGPMK